MSDNKRLVALLLAFIIVSMQIVRDTTTAKAFGAVTTASAIWEALTAASGAYAGYSMTSKQNKSVSKQLAGYLSDYVDTLIDAPWEHLDSVTEYISWSVSKMPQVNGLLESTSVYTLTHALCDAAGDTLDDVKSYLVQLDKNVTNIDTAKPTTPDDDDGGGLISALIKELVVSIAADGAISVGKKFIAFLGTLTDLIIKDTYNDEYQKAKGEYDWEALGFVTDYDSLNIVDKSTQRFSELASLNGDVSILDMTVLEYVADDGYRTIQFLPAGIHKTAVVTIHDYDADTWRTYCVPEDVLYKHVVEFRAGNETYADVIASFGVSGSSKPKLLSDYDSSIATTTPSYYEVDNNRKWYSGLQGINWVFDGSVRGTPYSFTNYTCKSIHDGGNWYTFFLNKSNCNIYNCSKTANFFIWNISGDKQYIGSTTALNGIETMQPTVKPSKYTNTADEIDKSSDTIIINNYVVNNYSDTDNVINNIANDNDMHLDTNDDDDGGTTSDYTSLLKSILSTLRNIPKNTYKYFANKLDMIINAIQSGSSDELLNNLVQINNLNDGIYKYLANINGTLFDINSNGLSFKNVSVDLDVNNFALTLATEINTVLVNVFIPADDYFDNKFTVINNQLETKLGYDDYINLINDIKEIKEAKPSNIVINTSNFFKSDKSDELSGASGDSTVVIPDIPVDESDGKSKITIVNFDIYYKYKDDIDAWVRGFVFIALLIFNIRHIYINVRGHDLGINTNKN